MARLLVALICLVPFPRVLAGQVDTATKDTTGLGARLTFSAAPFELREPLALRAPWLGAQRSPPLLRGMAWDTTVAAVLDSARQDRARALRYLVLYGEPVREALPDSGEAPPPRNGVFGLSRKYADLALDGQVRLELRTDRLRNERCNAAQLQNPNSGCRGGFKPP
ncbi:MAG TPA: hypothetical protein VFH24_07730, partial [Gemmatimonadales bacterium]|nr:hypothetical protein [Gemmatimonadales bacterium]